jgi:hypothetical protein
MADSISSPNILNPMFFVVSLAFYFGILGMLFGSCKGVSFATRP